MARGLAVPRHMVFIAPHPVALDSETMADPFAFVQDVRQEANKVTWPNRRETAITTLLVVVMCMLASLFLAVTDQLIHLAINLILGFGR